MRPGWFICWKWTPLGSTLVLGTTFLKVEIELRKARRNKHWNKEELLLKIVRIILQSLFSKYQHYVHSALSFSMMKSHSPTDLWCEWFKSLPQWSGEPSLSLTLVFLRPCLFLGIWPSFSWKLSEIPPLSERAEYLLLFFLATFKRAELSVFIIFNWSILWEN